MSLETNQLLHDIGVIAAGNSSPSLDPKDILVRGAQKIAAGNELGLSTEETLAAISRQARADRRAQVGPQRETLRETINDLTRQAMQARQQLGKPIEGKALRPAGTVSYKLDPSEALPEFVEDNSPTDILDSKAPRARNEDELRRLEIEMDENMEREDYAELVRAERRARRERNKVAKQPPGGDIGPFGKLGPYGRRAFENEPPTSLTRDSKAEDRNKDRNEFGNNPMMVPTSALRDAEQKARERASVARLIASEAERLAPGGARRLLNEARAQQQAEISASQTDPFPKAPITGLSPVFMYGKKGPGAPYQLGKASPALDAAVVDGVYVDPRTGQPVEVSEPISDVIAGSNTPNTSQQLNAPRTQSASEFVAVQTQMGSPQTANSPYPQVPINAILNEASERLARTQRFPEAAAAAPGGIRTISDLQKVSDAVIRVSQERGEPLGATSQGSFDLAETPGVVEALEALGIRSEYERERLALALKANVGGETRDFSADQNRPPSRRKVSFDSLDTEPRMRRLSRDSKTRRQLANAPEEVAEMGPFIGAVADEPYPRLTVMASADEIPAYKRIQFLAESLGSTDEQKKGLFDRASGALRRAGVENPTVGQVADLLQKTYDQQLAQGTLREIKRGPKRGQKKTLDEDALKRVTDEAVARRRRIDEGGGDEGLAIARLLRGPLRPGR